MNSSPPSLLPRRPRRRRSSINAPLWISLLKIQRKMHCTVRSPFPFTEKHTLICQPRCEIRFWSSRREAWPRMAPEYATVAKIFGSRAHERYGSEMTLMEAAASATAVVEDEEEEAFGRVVKEATVALLNSYARRKEFPYSAWKVKTLFIKALVSKEAAALQSQRFAFAKDACNHETTINPCSLYLF